MAEREPPQRWLEAAEPGLPRELLAGLRACAEDGPSELQQRRMQERALRSLAAGGTAAPVAWKLASLLVLASLAGTGLWWWSERVERGTQRSSQHASTPERAAPSAPDTLAPAGSAAEASTPPGSMPTEAAEANAPTSGIPTETIPGPATRTKPARRAASAAQVTSELELLTRARRALGSAPARTLELAAQHARSYGEGMLGQERELLAIEALVKLQRSGEARRRAARFAARHPRSAHLPRIGQLVGAP